MNACCPECEYDVTVPEDPEEDVACPICEARWAPGTGDPDPGWRVPVGGPDIWAQALVRYDQRRIHEGFVTFCQRANALDYAARRYRRVLERAGNQDLAAERALERIQVLAMATLKTTATQPRRELSLLVALVLALGLALVTTWLVEGLGLF